MSMSDYLEAKLLKAVLRGVPFSVPTANLYLGLFTLNPGDANTGTELNGNGYLRQSCAFYDPDANNDCTLSVDVTFSRAITAWGNIAYVAVFDDQLAGNMLFYGPLINPITINAGDTFKFYAGDLKINMD